MKTDFVPLLAFCALFPFCAFSGAPSSASNADIATHDEPPDGPNEDTTGDPVGCADGSVFENSVDLSVACPDMDLVFRRSYGSWSQRTGVLGYGWTHSYDWGLVEENGTISVYSAGENGPSDAVHRFSVPSDGTTVFNADGYSVESLLDGTYAVTTPETLKYTFDSGGRLASISSCGGILISFERDGTTGNVSRVLHSCGKWLGFEYSADGFLVRVTTPDESVFAEFDVGWHGEYRVLEQVTVNDGDSASTCTYRYSDTPAAGSKLSPGLIDILAKSRGMFENASVVPRKPVLFSGCGRLKAKAENGPVLGELQRARPVLTGKTDANGVSSVFEYTRESDAPSPKCVHAEMDKGVYATTLVFGNKTTDEYRPTAWGIAKTVYNYDDAGREISRTTGSESLVSTYDGKGDLVRKKSVDSESGAYFEADTKYDNRHRPVSLGVAFCSKPVEFTEIEWDDSWNIPRRIVSPEGRVSEWKRTGNDIAVYGAGQADERLVGSISLSETLQPRVMVSPDGAVTEIFHDESGYPTNVVMSCRPSVSFGYDPLGNVSEISVPGPHGFARKVHVKNNWRGRPISVINPDGSAESFVYEKNGNHVARHVDPIGREDIFEWTLGRPIHVGRIVNGVTNSVFCVERDKQLNAMAIIDPLGRHAETYSLDENERIVSVKNLEGQTMTRRYAVGGTVASDTRFDGSSVSYSYDKNGRLAAVEYPDETLSFVHDGDGLLTSASNGTGTVSNEHDAATGWLVGSCGTDGTDVVYSRRNGGAVSALASIAGTVSYERDAANRIVRLDSSSATMQIGYCDWNGLPATVANGNGFVAEYACDIMDRVTNITWRTTGGAVLGGFSYEYDTVGRIVSRKHGLCGERFDRTYSYDGMDRLVYDGGTMYEYDAAENRTRRIDGTGTISCTFGIGNRLSSWTNGSCFYNDAGCVTRIERDGRPTLDLTWNGKYQLVSVSTNGVFAEGYSYDALGRRASTTTAERTIRHVYDDNWQCIADIDEQGNVVASYIWGDGIDNLLAVTIGNESYFPLTDIQGTVWGYVDSSNDVVARWKYDAWGNVLSESVSIPSLATLRYRFQCREWSAATGLVNFRHRWYDPDTGRWISKDPIGLSGGLNLYVFVGNRFSTLTDPLGLKIFPSSWAPDWHTKHRDELNLDLPEKEPSDDDAEWKPLSPEKSIFHDNHKGKPERKYVHPDGREAVYDGDTGKLVTDNDYKGTYNYIPPGSPEDGVFNKLRDDIGHIVVDVFPYLLFGN